MPRKKLEWTNKDVAEFRRLCELFCDEDEICYVFGITPAELEKLLNKHLREEVSGSKTQSITFEDAFKKYSVEARISIRRKQKELALNGDRAMLIWIGKQYLGQTDPDKVQAKPSGSEAKQESVVRAFRAKSPVKAAG